ncbi:hypothetical protein ACFY7A_23675 [Streptomyces longwoodensis]|uniref:ATP-dependent DNA ligase n=1 Tax=Streptomyces longwoodensis TaxID=68231 RepID=UPI0036A0E10E
MTWSLPQPVLTVAVAVDSPATPAGRAAEPTWDGFRAQLAVHTGARVLLRFRQGTDMTASFPEIRAAAVEQLPADTGLDGELVVWSTAGSLWSDSSSASPGAVPVRLRRRGFSLARLGLPLR